MNKVPAENLFRRQAIIALADKTPGRPLCMTPRPWLWLTILIVTAFVVSTFFASTAEFARTETARGWLVATPSVVRVSHNASAQVVRVWPQPGDKVLQGQPLVQLSTDSSLVDGSSKNEKVLSQLRAAVDELERQQELLLQQNELNMLSAERQLADIDIEDQLRQREINQAKNREGTESDKLRKLVALRDTGAATEWDVLRQQDERGAARQQMNQLRQKRIALRRERERLASHIAAAPVAVKASVSALRSEAFRLSTELAEYESRRSFIATAPVAGTVVSVAAVVGSSSGPRQTLITLLPADWQLAAELFVPSKAAGFLHRGQTVRLNYDAFPRQKFGVFAGRIEQVSEFVLLPAELPQTFSLREASYKVSVSIQREKIGTGQRNARLRPGMLLAAEIVLEKRSLFDWLLEPLRLSQNDAA